MSYREDEILDPSDIYPEPPWGDADHLQVEQDKRAETGEYDEGADDEPQE